MEIKDIKEIKEKFIKGVIADLGRNGFCSEADFQFALAWKLKQYINNEGIKVRLEYLFNSQEESENDKHIDILIIQGKKWIPIELKFRKKEVKITENDGETYDLKTHGAKDCGCYNYLYDIQRIEEIREYKKSDFVRGFAIMITNDKSYLKKPRKNAAYLNFSIHIGRDLKITIDECGNEKKNDKVELDWLNRSLENKKKWYETSEHYKKKISIDDYKIQWLLYPNCEEIKSDKQIKSEKLDEFYVLINEIK